MPGYLRAVMAAAGKATLLFLKCPNRERERYIDLQDGEHVVGRTSDKNKKQVLPVLLGSGTSRYHAVLRVKDGELHVKDTSKKKKRTFYLGNNLEAPPALKKARLPRDEWHLWQSGHFVSFGGFPNEASLEHDLVQNITPNLSPSLVVDWSAALECGFGADVTVLLDGDDRAVHKAVLMTRSPVFRRMFETDMVERRTGNIDMSDVSTLVADRFIKFLYTDLFPEYTPDQTKECLLLLFMANKYQVEGLQARCCIHLAQNLNADNAVAIFRAAEKSNIPVLRHAAFDFMTSSDERLSHVLDSAASDDLDRDVLKEMLKSVLLGSRKRKSTEAGDSEIPRGRVAARLPGMS